MTTAELLIEAFDRIRPLVHRVIDGLTPGQLAFRLDAEANSIAWLMWHLTRIQDDHIADAAGTAQVWTAAGWQQRFALSLDPADTGYGHAPGAAAAVRVGSGDLLTGYYDEVHEQTIAFVHRLTADDLDRVVDTSWDPPVTLGVRLTSVIADDLQHVGQAAFARGIVSRRPAGTSGSAP